LEKKIKIKYAPQWNKIDRMTNRKVETCAIDKRVTSVYKNNLTNFNGGYSQLMVYDWLAGIPLPPNQPTFNIIEIKFKGGRKDYYINTENIALKNTDIVVVEAMGGHDTGHVSLTGELVRLQLEKHHIQTEEVIKKIYRKATARDIIKWKIAKGLELETMFKARMLAKALGLKMKISDVDYQGDKTKATFYYTAEKRVDFRELIQKMVESFHIRIEMRQIGMMEEASRLGGVGTCGREYCYAAWLTDFRSGAASYGRNKDKQWSEFKCCLWQEPQNYKPSLKSTDLNSIETLKGIASLQKKDTVKRIMWFSYPGEKHWIPVRFSRVTEIKTLIKEGMILKDLMEEAAVLDKPTKSKEMDVVNVSEQHNKVRLGDKRKNTKMINRRHR
jgi:cell fate regulator YaaT (PSP1 superfamily)